jgi:DNA-binding CsgD family transcriptional regulator
MSRRVVQGEHEPHLTRREMEVFAMVTRGYSVEKIAGQLFISPATVRQHLANIRRKRRLRGP